MSHAIPTYLSDGYNIKKDTSQVEVSKAHFEQFSHLKERATYLVLVKYAKAVDMNATNYPVQPSGILNLTHILGETTCRTEKVV